MKWSVFFLLVAQDWRVVTVEIINRYRTKGGVPPVRLLSTGTAQARAEELQRDRVFSHYTLTGRPPTLLWTQKGFPYAFEENLYGQWTAGLPFSWSRERIEQAIQEGIRTLVEEDGPSWLHRRSLLNPCHTRVDVGMVAVSDTFYLVVYMVTDRVRWEIRPQWNGDRFEMKGRLEDVLDPSGLQVLIFWDQYQPDRVHRDFYDLGQPLVGVVPSSQWRYKGLHSLVADRWDVKGQDIHVVFTYSPEKRGIYTVEVRAPLRSPQPFQARPKAWTTQTSCALLHYAIER